MDDFWVIMDDFWVIMNDFWVIMNDFWVIIDDFWVIMDDFLVGLGNFKQFSVNWSHDGDYRQTDKWTTKACYSQAINPQSMLDPGVGRVVTQLLSLEVKTVWEWS